VQKHGRPLISKIEIPNPSGVLAISAGRRLADPEWNKMATHTTAYILPQHVTAPKKHWSLVRVLYDGGEWEPAYAAGYWYGVKVLSARWNGNTSNRVGWPRIFVHPAWHVLEARLTPAVVHLLSEEGADFARRFLAGE
jgi:hypothetical protein